MQLLLTSAAPSNIGQGGDTIIQTQNCVSPCAWGQADLLSITNCHLCAGAMLSSRSIFQATRFVRVILEQGAMSSSQGKKNDLICACHPCANHTSVPFKKKLPISDLECHSCAGAMRQCPAEDKASGSSRSCYLQTSIRGSIVSPLVNTMGGLSGGRRGGDVSRAASAPSLVVARLFARALALDLACGIRCPPFVIRNAYASDGSSTPRRKSSAVR